jgi:hypothetical protein
LSIVLRETGRFAKPSCLAVAFSKDGKLLAAVAERGKIKRWRVDALVK